MKHLQYAPLFLLFSYITLMFFRPPSGSDSVIIFTLGALQAFCMFLSHRKEFSFILNESPELIKLRQDLEKEHLIQKINEIKTDANKRSLSKLGGANGSKINW